MSETTFRRIAYYPPKDKKFSWKRLRPSVRLNTHMRPYTWCSIFASIGGFLFGFDTGNRIFLCLYTLDG